MSLSARVFISALELSALVGLGTRFEAEDLKAYPLGSVVDLPGDTRHFHCAKAGE
jgi:hypothetical protein